jgi:signal transduction histidine kinase
VFDRVRLRLTLLYCAAALVLVVVMGGGAYALLGYYFQTPTDQALHHRMAVEFRQRGAALPEPLRAAEQAWYGAGQTTAGRDSAPRDHDRERDEHDDHASEAYDAQLAAIFVLPLRADGSLLSPPTALQPPIAPNTAAAAAALARGSDARTLRLANGRRVRLLTYCLPTVRGTSTGSLPDALQLGRILEDQDLVMRRLLAGLLVMGGGAALLIALGSWWLAGRSLRPAQVAMERQQTFVANASHELRAPLTLLRASAEMALRRQGTGAAPAGAAGNEQRALLGDVLAEADHMARLIDDLLLLARADAGRLPLHFAAIPVADLFGALLRRLARVAEQRGIRVSADATAVGGAAIWGDATRVQQVLLIVLENALRYTPRGGAVRLTAEAAGRYVCLVCADTGVGIAPEHVPHVFERFYRAGHAPRAAPCGDQASAGSALPAGSGLGLAIAKTLIEVQHGQISINSRPGQGTRAILLLPAAAPSPHPQPAGGGIPAATSAAGE